MKYSLLEAAADYAQRGWVCQPVRDKRPILDKWRQLPLAATPKAIEQRFHLNCNGIGIVAGRPSGNLLIVDIDDRALLPAFAALGELADTYTVHTRRGAHYYYIVGDKLLAAGDIHFSFERVQLIWNTQVVAPPSPGYELVNDVALRTITAGEFGQLYDFAKQADPDSASARPATPTRPPAPAPRPNTMQRPAATGQVHELQAIFAAHHAQTGSRNEALFRGALHARDAGITALEYAESVAVEFLQLPAAPDHRKQTPAQRHAELIASVKSAYSRPARTGQRKGRLWDSLRQHCAQTGNMALWRVLDGLYERFTLNEEITRQDAILALQGRCGKHSVVAALEAFDGQLFSKKKKVLPPPPTPKATQLPYESGESGNNVCYTVGVQKREKQKSNTNNPHGRPYFVYTLPPVRRVASVLNAPKKHKHSTRMQHATSKQARMALYKAKIQRAPGKYANVALCTWLGISKRTIKRYEKELKIKRQPQFDECPVHSWNIDELPWADAPIMGLWLTTGKKRYPALQSIAQRLIHFRQRVTLVKQLPNFISFGNLQQLDLKLPAVEQVATPQPLPSARPLASKPTPKIPAPRTAKQRQQATPAPRRPQRQLPPARPALEAIKRDWQRYEPLHHGDIEGRLSLANSAYHEAGFGGWLIDQRSFQTRWLKHKSPRAILKWIATHKRRTTKEAAPQPQVDEREKWTIREVQRLTALEDGKQTIARKTVKGLIASYGKDAVLDAAARCHERQNARNRAGLLIEMLSSNAKAHEFRRKWGRP